MSMSNFNLRNVPHAVMSSLKKKATKQKISVNSLILQIVEQDLGFTHQIKKNVFHDLDYLAGTWSEEDEKNFEQNVKIFEKIDEELWS